MWQHLLKFMRQVFTLMQDVEQLKRDAAEREAKLERLTDVVRQIAYELERDREIERRDRENMLLRLENEMLKFRQSLPPSTRDKD